MTKTISQGITYIGTDDLDLDLFESQYDVPEGMSYNSYLVSGGKTAILDTSDIRRGEEWKENLAEALAGRTPDYLVVHHMEPDHSALAAWALAEYPGLKLAASAKALQLMGQFFPGIGLEGRTITLKEGDTLDLEGRTLRFFTAPMVHWPEVMVSYDSLSGTLFTADGFGKFGALSKCGFWGDEDNDWACEARRYYFNICGKYGLQVQALLKKASTLDIKVIAPLHGPILRENLGYYLGLYDTWSSYRHETEGVFVACASIHGGTLEAAQKLVEILKAKGAPKVAFADLTRDDIHEAVEDAFRYPRMVVAAASYDAGLFTPAYNFLHLLQAKAYQKRKVALIENGSWAPSAGRVMKEMFGTMKDVTIAGETVTIRSRITPSDIPALETLAEAVLQ